MARRSRIPALARQDVIREDRVGYHHRRNRRVRRSFFCGLDPLTGNDDELNLWLSPTALASASAAQGAAVISNPFPARRASNRGFLSLALSEYLRLLDWTGRRWRNDKQGTIPHHLLPLLEGLKLDATRWPTAVAGFPRLFRFAAGRVEPLVREAERRGRCWLHGVRHAAWPFG